MPALSKYFRKTLVYLVGIYLFIIISGFVLDAFFQFRLSDVETMEYYVKKQQPIHIRYYEAGGRQMRYLYTGNATGKPLILFIHGAPSSTSYYRDYLSDPKLRAMANLVAVDRPGYGYSGLGEPVTDLGMQAAMIKPIIDSMHRQQRPVIVVGASYGTSVACRLTMDYPDLIDGLVLLAPSLAPGEEKTYDISYVLESPFFTWAQPRMIHSANAEKLSHEKELKKMVHRWGEIKVPVIYFQGAMDDLIYTTNAQFARRQLTNAAHLEVKLLPGLEHLIAFKARTLINNAITRMVDMSEDFYAQRKTPATPFQAGITAAAAPIGASQ